MNAGIGDAVRRKEDLRLVTGRGCYSDDFNFPGQAYGAAVRSPHAHALIRAIDVAAARTMPGVLAVLTGQDALADGLTRIPHLAAPGTPPDIVLHNRDGSPVPAAPHHVLPTDRVRHVGTAVAFVIAETVAAGEGRRREVSSSTTNRLPAVIEATAAGRSKQRAAALRRLAEHHDRRRSRRRSGDRRGLCARRPCHAARHLGQSRHRRADGAARRRRHLRRGERPLHALRRLGRHRAPEEGDCRQSSACRSNSVRVVAQRDRRQFRHAQQLLSRIRDGGLGLAARRPAGEMDRRTPRGVRHRLYGPRSHRVGRTRARCRWPLPGAAQLESQQCRRPQRLLRAAGQRRGLGDCRLSHSDRRISARARCSRPPCAPRPTAAPAGPRSFTSSSG